jgi:hypothetical protein
MVLFKWSRLRAITCYHLLYCVSRASLIRFTDHQGSSRVITGKPRVTANAMASFKKEKRDDYGTYSNPDEVGQGGRGC